MTPNPRRNPRRRSDRATDGGMHTNPERAESAGWYPAPSIKPFPQQIAEEALPIVPQRARVQLARRPAELFFSRLFAGVPADVDAVVGVAGQGRYTPLRWRSVTDVAGLANDVERHGTNVFCTMNPVRRGLEPGRRGGADDVAALVGWRADIDLLGPGHASTALPSTEDEAMEILDRAGVGMPTMIVRTGGGLHVYWIAEEAWIVADDRELARDLSRRFGRRFVGAAAELGWAIDNTFSLANTPRVPGSVRSKPACEPALVDLAVADGPTYPWSTLRAWAPEVRTPVVSRSVPLATDEHSAELVRLIVDSWDSAVEELAGMPHASGRHVALRGLACRGGRYLSFLQQGGRDPEADLLNACERNGLVDEQGARGVASTITTGIALGEADPYVPPPLERDARLERALARGRRAHARMIGGRR